LLNLAGSVEGTSDDDQNDRADDVDDAEVEQDVEMEEEEEGDAESEEEQEGDEEGELDRDSNKIAPEPLNSNVDGTSGAPSSQPGPSTPPTSNGSMPRGLPGYPTVRREALTATVYDIVPTIAAPHSTSINAITTTPDLRWVFSGGADGYIRKFNWVDTVNSKVMLTVAQRHPFVDSVTKAGVLASYWENEEPQGMCHESIVFRKCTETKQLSLERMVKVSLLSTPLQCTIKACGYSQAWSLVL
jgi:transcriptional activator SPT8